MLNGVDIAGKWQPKLDLTKIKADFYIMKISQGSWYESPKITDWKKQGEKMKMLRGAYHFLENSDPIKQVDFYLDKLKKYDLLENTAYFLDFEDDKSVGSIVTTQHGVTLAKQFLDELYRRTGVRAQVYTSLSVENALDWSNVVNANYGVWIAQYNNYDPVYGFNVRDLYGKLKHWKNMNLFQYTSNGRLNGYNDKLDLDAFYGNSEQWKKFTKVKVNVKPPASNTVKYSTKGKSLETIAKDVIADKVGKGSARRSALGNLYNGVQAIVDYQAKVINNNELITILATETVKNRYGIDKNRKMLLGSWYQAVQNRINQNSNTKIMYKVKAGDTVSGIANKYGVSINTIKKLNGLKDVNKIYVGQTLRVK